MKRMHIFEVMDQNLFPDILRQSMTRYLMQLHKVVGTSDYLVPILDEILIKTKSRVIYDLCSGSGGPIVDAVRSIQEHNDVQLILSDKYPPQECIFDTGVSYAQECKDVLNMTYNEEAIYTFIASFHHFQPKDAHTILQRITEKKHPICIFELSDNAFSNCIWWIPIVPSFITVFVLTLFVRPIRWEQWLFTYIIPILPFCIAWDGAVSNARTYTKEDWKELGTSIPNYDWEVREIENKTPSKMLAVIGLPRA